METVLIIDDSGINLRTAKEALDDYYNVVTANSCKMALRYLEKQTSSCSISKCRRWTVSRH